MSKQFFFSQSSLVQIHSLVLFDQYPYQVQPLRVRVDLEAMAMKVYSKFPKVTVLLEPHYQII